MMEDHLHDQRMQAGAGFHWNWWYGGSWADAVFLMRDVLAQAGRLERQCDYFLWNWGGRVIFAESDPPSHMDYYLLDVPRLLRACLMQAEATEQVRWLRAFQAMLERSILQPASALKIDGCAYHHGGHYFGYAFSAVPGLAETVQRLSDTPWRLSAEAHERLRRTALAQRIFCNQRDVPLSLSGRQPFTDYCSHLLPEGLDRLARGVMVGIGIRRRFNGHNFREFDAHLLGSRTEEVAPETRQLVQQCKASTGWQTDADLYSFRHA
jgi:hypothetical protein